MVRAEAMPPPPLRGLAGVVLWCCALLPRADAGANEYVVSSSPPERVAGGSIYFQNITHSSAVLRWSPPRPGDWGMEVEGYRLRIRSFLYTEEMFDVSLIDPDDRYARSRQAPRASSASRASAPGLRLVNFGCGTGLLLPVPAPSALRVPAKRSLRARCPARSTIDLSEITVDGVTCNCHVRRTRRHPSPLLRTPGAVLALYWR